MKMKRILALVMTAALTAGTLAGCGNTSSGQSEASGSAASTASKESTQSTADTKEGEEANAVVTYSFPLETPVEMSMFAIMNGQYGLEENAAFQKMEELTNVKWDVLSAMSSDLAEKKGLILASGDYPDVFYKAGISDAEAEKFGKQGIFIPLNDLIREYAPNLTKLLDEKDGWGEITSSDGNIYAIPHIGDETAVLCKLFINKKWLENVGKEEPKSLDELYEVLKAFKEQDANGNGDPDDEIPFTCTDVVTPELLLPYFGLTYNLDTKCAEMDGKLVYIPTSDVFKEYLAYITKLYQEGLLDKNAFTQKHEQQVAIGTAKDVYGCFFDAGAFLTVGRERDRDYGILTPFTKGTYPTTTGISTGAMAITDKCENPELAMAWVDQFYTEEGSTLAWMGIEGVSYELKDDGTWAWLTGKGYGDDISEVRQNATLQGAAQHPSAMPSIWDSGMTDPNEIYLAQETARVVKDGRHYPILRIDESDEAELANIKADTSSYMRQYTAQVATGELDLDSSWDTYLDTMNAMGVEKMQEIYTKAYEAGKALSNK